LKTHIIQYFSNLEAPTNKIKMNEKMVKMEKYARKDCRDK